MHDTAADFTKEVGKPTEGSCEVEAPNPGGKTT